jgi:hypothetical protein
MKHIEVHYHFIWAKILLGEIDVKHANIKTQVANILTKSLGKKLVPKI